jgi:hypothetical protein
VRYLWGYASHAVLPGPSQRFEQLVRFRDFSWNIEYKSLGTLSALASSVYGVHHWLKTGLYSLAGAETSQSNGNAQVCPSPTLILRYVISLGCKGHKHMYAYAHLCSLHTG